MEFDKLLAQAEQLLKRGKLNEATEKLESVLQADPQNEVVANRLALTYSDLGETEKAIGIYCQVAKRASEKGKNQKAIVLYKQALALNDRDPRALLGVAEESEHLGKFSDAVAFSEQLINHFLPRKKYLDILNSCSRIVRCDASHEEAKLIMIDVIRVLSDVQRLQSALVMLCGPPGLVSSEQQVGGDPLNLNPKVLKALEELVKWFPSDPLLNYTLAWVAYRRENFADAFAYLRDAFRIDPDYLLTSMLYARLLVELERLPEAQFIFYYVKENLSRDQRTSMKILNDIINGFERANGWMAFAEGLSTQEPLDVPNFLRAIRGEALASSQEDAPENSSANASSTQPDREIQIPGLSEEASTGSTHFAITRVFEPGNLADGTPKEEGSHVSMELEVHEKQISATGEAKHVDAGPNQVASAPVATGLDLSESIASAEPVEAADEFSQRRQELQSESTNSKITQTQLFSPQDIVEAGKWSKSSQLAAKIASPPTPPVSPPKLENPSPEVPFDPLFAPPPPPEEPTEDGLYTKLKALVGLRRQTEAVEEATQTKANDAATDPVLAEDASQVNKNDDIVHWGKPEESESTEMDEGATQVHINSEPTIIGTPPPPPPKKVNLQSPSVGNWSQETERTIVPPPPPSSPPPPPRAAPIPPLPRSSPPPATLEPEEATVVVQMETKAVDLDRSEAKLDLDSESLTLRDLVRPVMDGSVQGDAQPGDSVVQIELPSAVKLEFEDFVPGKAEHGPENDAPAPPPSTAVEKANESSAVQPFLLDQKMIQEKMNQKAAELIIPPALPKKSSPTPPPLPSQREDKSLSIQIQNVDFGEIKNIEFNPSPVPDPLPSPGPEAFQDVPDLKSLNDIVLSSDGVDRGSDLLIPEKVPNQVFEAEGTKQFLQQGGAEGRDSDSLLMLGDSYLSKNNFYLARKSYRKALESGADLKVVQERLRKVRALQFPEGIGIPLPETASASIAEIIQGLERDYQIQFEDVLSDVNLHVDLLALRERIDQEIKGGDPKLRIDLGVAFYEMGLYQEAENQFLAAIGADESVRFEAAYLAAQAMYARKNYAGAVEMLNSLIREPDRTNHELVPALYLVGCAYEALANGKESLHYFNKTAAIDSNFRDVRDRIVRLNTKHG